MESENSYKLEHLLLLQLLTLKGIWRHSLQFINVHFYLILDSTMANAVYIVKRSIMLRDPFLMIF